MSIDYSGLAFPKRPRVLDRIAYQHKREAEERLCRKVVKARDKGRCVVPNCKQASVHLHHIVYRSKGGRFDSQNIVSLCAFHHQFVHAGLLTIEGDADKKLMFKGRTS